MLVHAILQDFREQSKMKPVGFLIDILMDNKHIFRGAVDGTINYWNIAWRGSRVCLL
jgi:hypothetical protein